jgi:hypothetical protein
MPAENKTPFGLPTGRLQIKSADEPDNKLCFVEAQFNPKEIEIKRTVSWAKHAETGKANAKNKQEPGVHLEFTAGEGRSLTIELLFDAYEKSAEKPFTVDVAAQVKALETLASVREMDPKAKEDKRRPHRCMVAWNSQTFGTPGFSCVIDSLSTKYTMFDTDGTPLRATCTVSLKEANFLHLAKPAK